MKPTLIIVAAAALCGGLPAGAQTSGDIVAPPAKSTGPTVADTRPIEQGPIEQGPIEQGPIEQGMAMPPSAEASPINGPANGDGNGRTLDGINPDPNNSNGMAVNASPRTGPAR